MEIIEPNRRPMERILNEISSILSARGYSIRKLEEKLHDIGYDVNRGKIYRTFYDARGTRVFLEGYDDTIEVVLKALDLSSDDIIRRCLGEEREMTPHDREIVNFLSTPEAMPYLRLAYAQYQAMKSTMELYKEKDKASPK